MWTLRDLVDELLHAKVKAQLFGGDHAPTLGRLVLRDRIGAGAMGTVLSAYDPRLDRSVAVKVLRSAEDAARVLAEARALAKLAHPNVVAVYDADELDGVVFIVMELAPGVSLRAWLERPHGWREVVRVLREAGAGIAAAHAAGLVHRDIKPDNILVGDDRARVVDFGLAAPHDDGLCAGTPGYIAPEVLAGGAATALADQYSFAVTMADALGKRVDVPAWVNAVIARARAADPSARFASMAELVAALGDRRRPRWVWIAPAALAAAALVATFAYRGHASGATCSAAPERIATVWNTPVREKLRDALGEAAWTSQTVAAFDAHAVAWQTSYRRVCEASRVRGDQSDTLLDLRMRCLDRALERFGALASTLATGTLDPATRAEAPLAAIGLDDGAHCETLADASELAFPLEPIQRVRARAAEALLDRAWAAYVLGRYQQARDAMPAIEKQLAGVDAPRVRAALLALWSSIEARIGDGKSARARLDEALVAAAAAKAPELELDVWSRRLRNELFAGDPAKVIEFAPFARAAAQRAGHEGAELDGIVAQALRNQGKLDEARVLLDKALATKDPLRPDQLALVEMNRGSIDLALGDSKAALVLFQRARDRVVSSLGNHHPDVAIYEDKLAAAKRARGQLRDALRSHDHSIELRVAALGPADRAVATGLLYRAQTRVEAGDLTGARDDLAHALDIRIKVFGNSARVAELRVALGDAAAAAGDKAGARSHYEAAASLDRHFDLASRRYAIGDRVDAEQIPPLGPREAISVDRAAALATRVVLLVHAGQTDEARALAAQLRAHYRPELDPALGLAIGDALLAVGDRAGAADVLGKTVGTLGNEPTRTALLVYIRLARASDTQATAAARAAVSVFQALPSLERSDFDEMWALSKRSAP